MSTEPEKPKDAEVAVELEAVKGEDANAVADNAAAAPEPEAEVKAEAEPEAEDPAEPEDDLELENDLDVRITKMHVRTILNAMDKVLQGRNLNKNNVLRVTYALLSVTKKLKDGTAKMPGKAKKEALLSALRKRLGDEDDLSEDDRELVMLMAADVTDVLVEALTAGQAKCCVVQ